MIKVRIDKADKDTFWYSKCIGHEFSVIEWNREREWFRCTFDAKGILKSDCTVLSDDTSAPEHKGWCIKRTPENAEVLNKWANQTNDGSFYNSARGYICSSTVDLDKAPNHKPDGFIELPTVEEFFSKVGYNTITNNCLQDDQFSDIRNALKKDGEGILELTSSGRGHLGDVVGCIRTIQSSLEIKAKKLTEIFKDQKAKHNERPKEEVKKFYPGLYTQKLFDLMNQDHGLILTEGQMHDIIQCVKSLDAEEAKQEVSEELIPFDLQKWETNKYDVVQRNGLGAEVIKTNYKGECPVIAICKISDEEEVCHKFSLCGSKFIGGDKFTTDHDLFLRPKQETVYVNVYHGKEFPTKEKAQLSAMHNNSVQYIETIEVKKSVK